MCGDSPCALPSGSLHLPADPACRLRSGGPLQWDPRAWSGTVLGTSLWLLPLGVIAARAAPLLGLICAAGGVLLGSLGALLWNRRESLSAHRAVQLFLAGTTFVYAVVILLARGSSALKAGFERAGLDHPALVAVLLTLPPLLMLFFWIRERTGTPPPTE